MRELLTPGLAGVNPKAYIAHFKRLDRREQQHYLRALAAPDLRTHFKTIGENATVGLFLSISVEGAKLDATVGGSPFGEARVEMQQLQGQAIALGHEIEAKVVSGMLTTTLGRLPQTEAALREVRWAVNTLILAGDSGGSDMAPTLGWSMRGTISDVGTFYMPTETLRWDERGAIEPILRALADRLGATLDVRL